MKNIKNLVIVGALALLAYSCNDATDIVQDGELGDNITFQTVDDLNQYLNGSVYKSLNNSSQITFTSIFTDEVGIGDQNGGQALELHRFFLNPSEGYAASIWGSEYLVINRVNRLLEAAAKITPIVNDELDETAQYNNIIAQARLMRAYAYLELETYFAPDMSDDSGLGVILLDFVPGITTKLPRSTNGDIFALMEADLEFAAANLENHTGATAYYYASQNLINAIRARFYLYRKNYALAQQYAQQTIDESGLTLTKGVPFSASTIYNTNTPNPYRRIWLDLAQGETLFAIAQPAVGGTVDIASNFYFNATNLTGGAYLDMGRNLYNELKGNTDCDQVSTDIRYYSFSDNTRKIACDYATNLNYVQADVIPIDKYPGKTNAVLRNDLKIFRLSEMYFILAECAVHNGDLAGAAGYIKNVRDARRTAGVAVLPVYANETEAYADILSERRKELCFEGFRYIDIKRLGVLANKSIDRNATDDVIPTLPTTIPNTDYRFTLPIPQSELAANPIVQNPGYNN